MQQFPIFLLYFAMLDNGNKDQLGRAEKEKDEHEKTGKKKQVNKL